jgi:hypothetical protein
MTIWHVSKEEIIDKINELHDDIVCINKFKENQVKFDQQELMFLNDLKYFIVNNCTLDLGRDE